MDLQECSYLNVLDWIKINKRKNTAKEIKQINLLRNNKDKMAFYQWLYLHLMGYYFQSGVIVLNE